MQDEEEDTLLITGKLETSGLEFLEKMEFPQVEDEEYKFVRICQENQIPLIRIEKLENKSLKAHRVDNEWKFYEGPSLVNQLANRVKIVDSKEAEFVWMGFATVLLVLIYPLFHSSL